MSDTNDPLLSDQESPSDWRQEHELCIDETREGALGEAADDDDAAPDEFLIWRKRQKKTAMRWWARWGWHSKQARKAKQAKQARQAKQVKKIKQATVSCLLLVALSAATTAVCVFFALTILALAVPRTKTHDDASNSHENTMPDRNLAVFLHPEDHVGREPRTSRLFWNISRATIAPNGVWKSVILVNGMVGSSKTSRPDAGLFPGPTIEARSGDTVVIELVNSLDEPVSLHWHGLHMRGANHMDGPVGITQCPIAPAQTFVYEIPTSSQAGTFWYHAHSEVQRADGLYGGFIIHGGSKVAEQSTLCYDRELLLLVGDWYHWPASRVLGKFMDPSNDGNEPCPDSLLVNGQGYFECSTAIPAEPVDCTSIERPRMALDKQLRYRVRLVNVGSLTGITMTVPDADLQVVQVDGGLPVVPVTASSLGVLYPAQRVDFVMAWPDSAMHGNSELIIDVDNEYFFTKSVLVPRQSFAIVANTLSSSPPPPPPPPPSEVTTCNLRQLQGLPLATPLPEPEDNDKFMIYAVVEILSRQHFVPKGYINHTTWEPQSSPLLVLPRTAWDSHQLVPWTGAQPAWVELTINNIDTQGHPFHLHGFDFYVVGSHQGNGGWDYYNPFTPWRQPRGGPLNVVDPIARDTVYVPAYGYTVLRFLADNKGLWTLHCHILWHQASGMTMAFQVLGDERGLSTSRPALLANKQCNAR